jgi:hypothetical protein
MKGKKKKQIKATVSRRVLSAAKQFAYPPEFRIGAPNSVESVHDAEDRPSPAPPPAMNAPAVERSGIGSAESVERLQFLADIGTALWRLRQKMVQPGTDEPLEEMRRAYRHFEAAWDLLAQTGVEIQDHTDKPFDTGMDLAVLTFQPMPDLKREQVVETIRPTIYYNKRTIQRGEVIVGRPEGAA